VSEAVKNLGDPVRFLATVARVSTLADGGLRVTLDLPESAVLQAAELMEAKRIGATLNVQMEPSPVYK
jgi:hypothetical protein